MEGENRFFSAMRHLCSTASPSQNASTLSHQLASEIHSSLSIFRCVSELTRTEALELLVCLTFHGDKSVSAAIRIAATLRSHAIAWETLSKLIACKWNPTDLALLAVSFGSRARFARKWTDCIHNALNGDDLARFTMAALMERRDIKFDAEKILEFKGLPICAWNSQLEYEDEPSVGQELAWSTFAAQRQLEVESSRGGSYTDTLSKFDESSQNSWLREAQGGNSGLNDEYFRMFGNLIRKRATKNDDEHSMDIDSSSCAETSFAITPTVREVFFEFSNISWTCKPVLLEGPHGCGKSASIARLAHITASGKNIPKVGQDNIFFVHMDTATNKEDSSDFSSLVGSVVPLPQGGGFQWRHGPIGHAIVSGSWLVLENMDCDYRYGNSATSALVSQLSALRPGDMFPVASRIEPLQVGIGFRLFATRTLKDTKMKSKERWIPPGGWDAWHRIDFPRLSEEEQSTMLRARFPSIFDCIPRVLQTIKEVSSIISSRGKALDRDPTFREAVSVCERLVLARQGSSFSTETALLETLDVLVGWASDPKLRDELMEICSKAWSLPHTVGSAMMKERKPELKDASKTVEIGRSTLLKNTNSDNNIAASRKILALTKHTRRTLERIATCVGVGESVLLNGETGTGKTSTLQELARLMNKELIVVNMSRQSDVADLIGGFRPLEVAAVLPNFVKRFEEAFCRHMSGKRNAAFMDALFKAARKPSHHGRALRLVRGAIGRIPASVRSKDHETALEWNRIEKMAARLEKLLPPSREPSKAKKEDGSQPPRKRQRSSPKPEEEEKVERINFEYADGALVRALREGHWILLDEINLAPVEVLDHLVSLLDHGSVIVPNEEGETVRAADGFGLFAAMNPPTDFGKRPLPKEIRSRMTEFFIDDIEDKDDVELLVAHRLFGVDASRENHRKLTKTEESITRDVAAFYLAVRDLAKTGAIDDSTGKCARFSLRTLSRMLSFVSNVAGRLKCEKRALYEGACFAFVTPLPRSARPSILKLAKDHLLKRSDRKKRLLPLHKLMNLPPDIQSRVVSDFPIEIAQSCEMIADAETEKFVVTAAVSQTLVDVCRTLTFGVERVPVLLQGPTSAGKTSLISYLARQTGNKLIRINNHEHTDLAEYLGCYVANNSGSLFFQEGPLVRAVREGHWVVLDELNLAPPEVLESLNRLLDDNKEIRIPETDQVVKAHPNFTLFATQNPPGLYGGRKELSRAFRGRFIEVQVDELPDDDLIEIIMKRCQLPKSFATKMVAVMRELQMRRRESQLFSGKSGFVTARDLFRWGARNPSLKATLAIHGMFLLGERARNAKEREIVRTVLASKIGVDATVLHDSVLYGSSTLPDTFQDLSLPSSSAESELVSVKEQLLPTMEKLKIAPTPHMMRMITLLLHCAANNEPALLVGPTGTGKTSACDLVSTLMSAELLSVNCHQHTESSDLVGGFRPCRRRTDENSPLFEWADGPLVNSMVRGNCFLMDEINMADDAVVERLNAVLEPGRTLMLSEKGSESCVIVAHPNFRVFATMNPGGDFGKKELSPALRNRFTEIWIPSASALEDFFPVIRSCISTSGDSILNAKLQYAQEAVRNVLVWMSDVNDKNSYTMDRSRTLSLRDVSAWSTFIQRAVSKVRMEPMVAFAHGARLVFLDGISVGTNSSSLDSIEARIWERVIAEVPEELKQEASKASFRDDIPQAMSFSAEQGTVNVGLFSLKGGEDGGKKQNISFCTTAPCTLRNFGRAVRAMSIDSRSILMEGPPGAGKTSLVSALASMLNITLSRINLSESTEMSDLIGGDVPGSLPGQFCFRRGELLRAMESGSWVLLDEMNLASQSVLEGLNSLLDHRRSVFVPELASEIVAHPEFRLFAAQNPAFEGCGRRGLPQSFLNRFVKVSIEAPTDNDLFIIASEQYPCVDKETVAKVVRTISRLRGHFGSMSSRGTMMEFGLRQVLRLCSLMNDTARAVPDAELCFDVVVLKALQYRKDRESALSIFFEEFERRGTSLPLVPSVRKVDEEHIRVGWRVVISGNYLRFNSLFGFDSRIEKNATNCMQTMAVAAVAGWPCIVSAEPSFGSFTDVNRVLEDFAGLCGQKLSKVKGGAFLDADDLLGGYAQRDTQAEIQLLRSKFLDLYRRIIETMAHENISNAERAIVEQVERGTAFLHSTASNFCDPTENRVVPDLNIILSAANGLEMLSAKSGFESEVASLVSQIQELVALVSRTKARRSPLFAWEKSQLVEAIERGDWILFEGANHCPSAVLDRLNPLLESTNLGSSSEFRYEPVLLPEAPPNADGSSAVIVPHPNFRIFFALDDTSGAKLSRAIVDRSVMISLDFSYSRDASIQSNAASISKVIEMDIVKTEPQSDRDVSTGIADFHLRYEQSAMMQDVYLLRVIEYMWASENNAKEIKIWPIHLNLLNTVMGRLIDSASLKTNTNQFKSKLTTSIIHLFLLGSISEREFGSRLYILRGWLAKASKTFSGFFDSDEIDHICVEKHPSLRLSRSDLCIDPVFGMDSVLPKKIHGFACPPLHFIRGISFRFEVLILSKLRHRWSILSSELESRQLGRDCILAVSRKFNKLSKDNVRHRTVRSLFSDVAYPIFSLLGQALDLFKDFLVATSDNFTDWNIPNEFAWFNLFNSALLFEDIARKKCQTFEEGANCMVLFKRIDHATSDLKSDGILKSFPKLRAVVDELCNICSERPRYENLRYLLAVPIEEFSIRTERELCVLSNTACSSSLKIGSSVVPKALVNLSSSTYCNDGKFKESMERLLAILQNSPKVSDVGTTLTTDSQSRFPTWDLLLTNNLEGSNHRLLSLLQSCESDLQRFQRVLSDQSKSSLLEFSFNPIAPLLSQVFGQRIAWMVESRRIDKLVISSLLIESQISVLKNVCARLSSDLESKSPEYLFASCGSSPAAVDSLISYYRVSNETNFARLPKPTNAIAVSCSLISGELYASSGKRGLRENLYQLLVSLKGVGFLDSRLPDLYGSSTGFTKFTKKTWFECLKELCAEVAESSLLKEMALASEFSHALSTGMSLLSQAISGTVDSSLDPWILGILSLMAGVARIDRTSNEIDGLMGVDPSKIAEVEIDLSSGLAEKSLGLELACRIGQGIKTGADDIDLSPAKLQADESYQRNLDQVTSSRKRIRSRPTDFSTFSDFVGSISRIVELISDRSLIGKFLGLELNQAGNVVTSNQLVTSAGTMFEMAAASLEPGGNFGHFRDFGGEFCLGIREVQHGMLLLAKAGSVRKFASSHKKHESTGFLSKVTKFPRAISAFETDASDIVRGFKSSGLDANVQADVIRFLAAFNWNRLNADFSALTLGFSHLISIWKRNLLVDEEESEIKNSLFVIKEKARVESMPGMGELRCLEEDEEEDYEEVFNADVLEIDELMTGEQEDKSDDDEETMNQELPEAPKKRSALDPVSFWNYHRICFLESGAASEADVQEEKKTALFALLISLGQVVHTNPAHLPDSGIIMGTLSACATSSVVAKTMGGANPKIAMDSYNFYKDDNPGEVSVLKMTLRKFIHAVSKIQELFFKSDGYHPPLTHVSETADRALRASDMSGALGTLVSVLENVIRKADEWVRLFATRAMSLDSDVKELSKLAFKWRRLEVESWPNLLNSREELAKRRAEKWFCYLYDSLVRAEDVGDSGVEQSISTMDQFLRSSPLGEFGTRIRMLQSLSKQLDRGDHENQRKLGRTLSGLCALYSLFLPKINDVLENASEPIKKKMKDFSRISNWEGAVSLGGSTKAAKGADKDLEYFRLKSKSEKVRRKLHKLCREIDAVFNTSAFGVISKEIMKKGFVDLGTNPLGKPSNIEGRLNRIPIMDLMSKEFVPVECPSEEIFDQAEQFEAKYRLSNCKKLAERMQSLSTRKSFAVNLLNAAETCTSLRRHIRLRAMDLRCSADAGIQVKKRAFVDLLRSLEKMGISPFHNPSTEAKEVPSYWLGINSPFKQESSTQLANHYFFGVGNRLQRLRAVSDGRVRNADVTPDESKKAIAFTMNLFVQSTQEREKLDDLVPVLENVKAIAFQMARHGVSSSWSSVEGTKQILEVLKRINEVHSDFNCALGIAEDELSRAENCLVQDSKLVHGNRYATFAVKRSFSEVKQTVTALKAGCSHLEVFLGNESVVKMQRYYDCGIYVLTSDQSAHCTEIVKLLKGLEKNLHESMSFAEKVSEYSLTSSLIGPVLTFLGDTLPSIHGVSDSFKNDLETASDSILLEKCDVLVEDVLRSVQSMLGSAGEEIDAMELPNEEEKDVQASFPKKFMCDASKLIVRSASSTGLVKIRNLMLEICALVSKSNDSPQSQLAVQVVGNFVSVFLNSFAVPFMQASSSFHLQSLGMLKTLTALFIGLSEEGYCRPAEEEEGEGNDEEVTSNVDGVGFGEIGDGDASLAQDVSAEVEEEEQLLGLRNDPEPEHGNEKNEQKTGDDTGVEMQTDFDGDLQNMERPDDEGEEGDENSSDEKEDPDKTFGGTEGDDNAMDIDEKLWDPKDEPEEQDGNGPETEEGEVETGKKDNEANLKAKEDPDKDKSQKPQNLPENRPSKPDGDNEDGGKGVEDGGEGEEDGGDNEDKDENGLDEEEGGEAEQDKKKKRTPKPRDDGDSDDNMTEDINGNLEQENKLDDDAPMDTDNDEELQKSGEDGDGLDDDETMTGGINESSDVQEEENNGVDGNANSKDEQNVIDDEVMENLNDGSGDEHEGDDVHEGGADEFQDTPMDDLPPENQEEEGKQANRGEEPGDESKEPEQEILPGDTEEQNAGDTNSNPVAEGNKTTHHSQNNQEADPQVQMFSDANGAGATGNQEENVGASNPGAGMDTGDMTGGSGNPEEATATAATGVSMEEFDPFAAKHDPNPFRENYQEEIGEEWEKCMNVLEEHAENEKGGTSNGNENDLHEFVSGSDPTQSEKATLAPATEEQHQSLPEGVQDGSDDEKEQIVRQENKIESAANGTKPEGSKAQTGSEMEDDIAIPSEDVTMIPKESTAETVGEHPLVSAMRMLESMQIESMGDAIIGSTDEVKEGTDSKEVEEEMNEEIVPKEVNGERGAMDLASLWRKLEHLTEADSAALSEQLRLVLEPTVRGGLSGGFKSGKRLDMKKVIDFVASDFRRDRIWLRRIRPSKRSYDVLVAIDNSESMTESGAGALGLAGLVLLVKALSKLEVGRVGVLKFGDTCEVVRDLDESTHIDEKEGVEILEQFTFQENRTNLMQLLGRVEEVFGNGGGGDDDVQLLFVISDGKLSDREELRKKLRTLSSKNVLVAFIVVNSDKDEGANIFNVKHVTFGDDGKQVVVTPYMNEFPFRFYTVVDDVKLLPNVLGNALRQWLELMSTSN